MVTNVMVEGHDDAQWYDNRSVAFELPLACGTNCNLRGCYYDDIRGFPYLLSAPNSCIIGKNLLNHLQIFILLCLVLVLECLILLSSSYY